MEDDDFDWNQTLTFTLKEKLLTICLYSLLQSFLRLKNKCY